jgi:hypothetical protein
MADPVQLKQQPPSAVPPNLLEPAIEIPKESITPTTKKESSKPILMRVK